MFESDEIEAQVREMAQLTMLSNKINPIQEKNLKMYPMVYFNGIRKVTINFDLTTHKTDGDEAALNNSFVTYHLDIDESQDNSNIDLRFQYIERAVRNLFWNNVRVYVYFNGKLVKESVKNGK